MNVSVRSKRKESELGQSLVEFTLIAVLLAMTLAGIADLGRAYFAKIAITDAAGEGAVYAAFNPLCVSSASGAGCADPRNITYRVQHASESPLVDWNNVTVGVIYPPVIASGQNITITTSYGFTLITPFISNIVGGDVLNITAQAAQQIQ